MNPAIWSSIFSNERTNKSKRMLWY